MSLKYTHTKTRAYAPSTRKNSTIPPRKRPYPSGAFAKAAYESFTSRLRTRWRPSFSAPTRERVFSNEYPDFGGSLGTAYVDTTTSGFLDSIQRTYRAEAIT